MIKRMAGTIFLILFFLTLSCGVEEKNTEKVELKTPNEKFSYAMGMDIAKALNKLETKIDLAAFLKGAEDSFKGNEPLLDAMEISELKKEIAIKEREKKKLKIEILARENLQNGQKFLEEKKKDKDVISTGSGLLYRILSKGEGKKPGIEDRVMIHYVVAGINGEEIDSSVKRGNPAVVTVKGVIPGLNEALRLMTEGSKFRIFIPPELAYGAKSAGPGGKIHPNSTLVFEVELVEIKKTSKES